MSADEVERLRAEVERLVQKIDREAYRKGLVLRRAKDAEAALAVERARLAKVEAACDPENMPDTVQAFVTRADRAEIASYFRAALASVPEPSASEPAPDADPLAEWESAAIDAGWITEPAPDADREAGGECHASSDGECHWARCPQIRDGEPVKSGRHCPLDDREDGAS